MSIPFPFVGTRMRTSRVGARRTRAGGRDLTLVLVGGCVTVLAMSIFDEWTATVVGVLVLIGVMWRARPDGVVALMVLFQSKWSFYWVSDFTTMASVDPLVREVTEVSIAGLPADAIAYIALAGRVIYERFLYPATFASGGHRRLVNLWLVTAVPALVLFAYSYEFAYPRWSIGLRHFLTVGAVFYGMIVARSLDSAGVGSVARGLVPYVVLMMVLMNLHVYWSHQGFVLIALAVALSSYLVRLGGPVRVLLGIAVFAMALRIVAEGTLTIGLVAGIAFCLVLLGTSADGSEPVRGWRRALVTVLVFLPIVFPFLVIYASEHSRPDDAGISAGASVGEGLTARISAKALLDRAPLWSSAYEQIRSGPKVVVPADRPLDALGTYEGAEWTAGAHNAVLEVVRNTGVVVGFAVLFTYLSVLRVNLVVALSSASLELRTLAAGVSAVALGGLLTGDFPTVITAGLFIWMLAGIVLQVSRDTQRRRDTDSSARLDFTCATTSSGLAASTMSTRFNPTRRLVQRRVTGRRA